MSITTINSTDNGANSLIKINDNFTDLDTIKADLASPTFTGTPSLPTGTTGVTQSASDNSTKLATTAYVDAQVLAGIPTQFSTTQVFTGTMPTSWTDLNLSSVVGVRQRMVLIKVYDTSASTSISFRPNGDTTDYSLASETQNIGLWKLSVSSTANVAYTTMVKTDTSGIIEWIAGSGTGKIDVLAYW